MINYQFFTVYISEKVIPEGRGVMEVTQVPGGAYVHSALY